MLIAFDHIKAKQTDNISDKHHTLMFSNREYPTAMTSYSSEAFGLLIIHY
jgi:hypothetical protein